MKGDKEAVYCRRRGRCSVPKPIDPARLKTTLNRLLAPSGDTKNVPVRLCNYCGSATCGRPDPQLLDYEMFVSRLLGDRPLAREILNEFLQPTFPSRWSRWLQLFHQEDFSEVRRLAHQMKGAAGNVCADTLCRIVSALENGGRGKRQRQDPPAFRRRHNRRYCCRNQYRCFIRQAGDDS